MTSLNAHCGPVDFLVAASSTLSPDMLKRDSLCDSSDQGSDGGGGGGGGSGKGEVGVDMKRGGGERVERSDSSSQDSVPRPTEGGSGSPHREERSRGVLLQYRLRSTSQLPGKLLTARLETPEASSPDSPEHSPEDGSIYELSEDPEVWVRGRPVPGWGREVGQHARRDKVTSAAVFSGGRGYRRLGEGATTLRRDSTESTLLVWQLPLTLSQ